MVQLVKINSQDGNGLQLEKTGPRTFDGTFDSLGCSNFFRDLKHRRRGRQRERQKTIVLISKTLTPHVHYTLWYISLPSSAKQGREMTKFKVLWRT